MAILEERGLDPSQEFPKPLTDETAQEADVIVTMGCGDTCPVYPGKRYLDWELDDPAGLPLEQVRPSWTRSIGGSRLCLQTSPPLKHRTLVRGWIHLIRDSGRFS